MINQKNILKVGLINLCQYSIEEYILYFLNHQYTFVSIICTQSKKPFLTSSCGSNVNIKKIYLNSVKRMSNNHTRTTYKQIREGFNTMFIQ